MSADPWVHNYLINAVRRYVREWQGRDVVIYRFMQKPVRGTLLRGDEGRGLLVVAGAGSVPVDQIERIEADGRRS